MKQLALFLSLITILITCTNPPAERNNEMTLAANPDSLIASWNKAWNDTDSTTLFNLFTNESQVIFSAKQRLVGKDSILNYWIKSHLPMVRNLKTSKFYSATSDDMAYYSGSYTLDRVEKDSIVGSDEGCFTAIWNRDSNNVWKMNLLFFGSTGE